MLAGYLSLVILPDSHVGTVEELVRKEDIHGLVRALSSRDLETQTAASRALGQVGAGHSAELIAALTRGSKEVKLGIIEALGEIRDPGTLDPLIACLADPDHAVRWEAALALGSLGDLAAIPSLVLLLRDRSRYVRYGAALALRTMEYIPPDMAAGAFLLLGVQDWEGLATIGPPAVPALSLAAGDEDPSVRLHAARVLRRIGDPAASPALSRLLADTSDEVRWEAVLAAPHCGYPLLALPRAIAMRPRIRKNPYIAALLNFSIPGMGYNYLGKWWGILVFQTDVYITLWFYAHTGEGYTYSLLLPIYLALAAHAYYMAVKMPDLQ